MSLQEVRSLSSVLPGTNCWLLIKQVGKAYVEVNTDSLKSRRPRCGAQAQAVLGSPEPLPDPDAVPIWGTVVMVFQRGSA